MAGFFVEHRGVLNLAQQQSIPNQGFRLGQVGALHAVLAHATVHEDPAIVCLPTGYGKTSLMMALPLLVGASRVLIIEPSDALRKQVVSHYRELSTLRRIGAIPPETPNPQVHKLEGRPADAQGWEQLAAFDVVVSTPASASPVLAPGARQDLFDLVIFDEAHHAPAETWAAFLEHYTQARFVFLTATPFRRDGRVIPGKLVYRYPVTRAVAEGAFRPVAFRAAPVVDRYNDAEIDLSIAQTAVAQLQADTQQGKDHRLFVRASSISAARGLVPLYQGLGVAVEAIDSKVGKKRQDECERKLVSGELQGIVCVDMFGEGYDFPKLKVAALHAPHRSLVPTIQFIGRFARSDATTGDATLIAPLERISDAPTALLKEGVNLAQMIDQAAREEIEGNLEEQEVLEQLAVRKVAESDYDAVSPLSLHLYAHIRIFRCVAVPDFTKIGETVGRSLRTVKHWLSDDGTVTLVLTLDESPPRWVSSEVLMNLRHDAFLLMYFPQSRLCYIGSTRRTEKIYQGLMDLISPDSRPLSYEETSRARAGLEDVKFFNVGLKNTAFNSQAETYRTLTGPAAERAVTAGDSRAYSQGHFFGSGMVGEEKETIGASSSSRVWSNQNLSVAGFMAWVEVMNARITGTAPFAQTQLDIVRSAQRLRQIPANVIAGNWAKAGFKINPKIRFKHDQPQFTYKRLTDFELCNFQPSPAQGKLDFSIAIDDKSFGFQFSLQQGAMIALLDVGVTLEVESALDEWMDLHSWLVEHPPIFYAADMSSFEGVNLMAAPQKQAVALTPGDAQFITWTGCAIGTEFILNDGKPANIAKRAQLAGQVTVQEHLERHLTGVPELVALFYDHRSGEAADYIAFTQSDDGHVNISLYHCKGAGGAPSGGRVADVYEVAGQLVKSVFYCDVRTLLDHMKDRMSARHLLPSRFVVGDFAIVENLLDTTIATKRQFSVVGVQPGISSNAIDAHLADLMLFGVDYAKRGGASQAYWLVSQ